ncbi:MAG: sulfatase [Planctomycetes bacterium SM23_32]|nr:MAG: sulfatase [Planctomycetes bacterium SM23_32]
MAERPNILYLHSHDTGRYVQPYGYAVPTPNLQRLAEQGVLFRQCFCGGPTCSPSRAALLTGQSAHSSGMIGLAHRGFGLNDVRQHIVHALRAAGYASALIGVQHVVDWRDKGAESIGYDRVIHVKDGWDHEEVAGAAAGFFRDAPEQPFFLSVGFVHTHREYPEPGSAEDPRYCRPPAPLPDTPETRRDMACYKASARMLDQGMGAVLGALERSGMAEETLVICTTDHGIAFPGMKCNLTDHGIGVMLMMRGPGGFEGGRVCDALISQIDVFPTLCELLGIEPPQWLQGRSFLPVVRSEAREVNQAVFSEVTYHAAYEPMRCVRTGRWKYIRRFDDRGRPVLPNCDDSPSKDVWLEHGWADRPLAEEELYDLAFDPSETANLASDPARGAVLDEMRGRLERWMEATGDPILDGLPVPAPPGSRVNDPDGLSPNDPTTEN